MIKFISHMLPKSEKIWTDDETCVDLSGNWTAYAQSLVDFANLTKPNVLIEHEVTGGTHGRVLSAWHDAKGVWGKLEIDETTLPQNQKYRWVSPRIAWHHIDVNGKEWPAALLECSLVSIPRFLVGQEEILETALSQIKPALNEISNLACSELQEFNPGETMTPELLEALRQLIREELATSTMADSVDPTSLMADPTEATVMSDPTVEVEVKSPEADPLALMADATDPLALMSDPAAIAPTKMADPAAVIANPTLLSGIAPSDYVATLSEDQKTAMLTDALTKMTQVETQALMSQVKAVCASRGITDSTKVAAFARLAAKDKRAFVTAMSAIPTRSQKASPNTVAASRTSSGGHPALRALELKKAGNGSFAENLTKLTGNR